MSTQLSPFPQRIAIGQFDGPNGRPVLVYQTVEFNRAISSVFSALGGSQGYTTDDLAIIAQESISGREVATPDSVDAVAATVPNDSGALVMALSAQVQELQNQLMSLAPAMAEIAELRQALEGVRQEAVAGTAAEAVRARQLAEELAISYAAPSPYRTTWERPGAIGSLTAGSGAFTTLSANSGMTVSGGLLRTLGGANFHTTTTVLTNFAGAAAGTLANAPTAGNPAKWIAIDDNGTARYIPTWI